MMNKIIHFQKLKSSQEVTLSAGGRGKINYVWPVGPIYPSHNIASVLLKLGAVLSIQYMFIIVKRAQQSEQRLSRLVVFRSVLKIHKLRDRQNRDCIHNNIETISCW